MLREEEAIIRKYDKKIKGRIVNAVGKITQDWEDIRGEIFLSICKVISEERFRGDCKAGTLVYVIVERRISDFLRRKYAYNRSLESAFMAVSEYYPSPEDIYIEQEKRLVAKRLIQKLQGWRQKQIAQLTLQDFTPVEISEKLGPASTFISQCLSVAKCNLRNMYRKEVLK